MIETFVFERIISSKRNRIKFTHLFGIMKNKNVQGEKNDSIRLFVQIFRLLQYDFFYFDLSLFAHHYRHYSS